jgi:ribulose-phosphate 3-epimerase
MDKKIYIAPSILSADFAKLGAEVRAAEKAGGDIIHVDVMDGHFVPNITIGPPVVKAIRKATKLPLDCHLMIGEPAKYIEAFAEAGADMISVHLEACRLDDLLYQIRRFKCKAGAVINPSTPAEKLEPYAELSDYVLVMTVNPGFSGQEMMEGCIKKVAYLDGLRKDRKLRFLIEADGGIKAENIKKISSAGCDIFVAGSEIFGKPDYAKVIAELKKNAS